MAKAPAVECRKDADVVCETVLACNNIDGVMETRRELVEIVHTLEQVVCMEG